MVSLNELRIVFFGTPDFAVKSLEALVNAGLNVVAVVTAPDKPAGRGMVMQSPAVKVYAEANSLPVIQPVKLKDPGFINQLSSLRADLQVVVAFRMLPEAVWSMPPLGTINVHASLLPQYRGAAPINWAIINGETETGVTTFKLQHEIDTGNILLQRKVAIQQEDNAGTLHDKLMEEGASLLLETINGLYAGTIREISQANVDSKEIKHAPKIFKEHLLINWNQPVRNIHNFIRGMSPFPAAFTTLDGKNIKLYSSGVESGKPNVVPGSYETDHKTFLRFAGTDGWVYIKELQQEGKKRMDIVSFLRGFRG